MQCNDGRGRMNKLTAEGNTAGAREATGIENPRAADVAREAISRDICTAKRRASPMKEALISFCTEVDDSLCALSLCCATIWSAVESTLGSFACTMYEAFREILMSLCGHNDRNVDCGMDAVHRHLHRLRGNVDACRARILIHFGMYPPYPDSGSADQSGSSSSAS